MRGSPCNPIVPDEDGGSAVSVAENTVGDPSVQGDSTVRLHREYHRQQSGGILYRDTSPFRRGPHTRQQVRADGATVLTVTVRELTPFRAKLVDRIAFWSALTLFGCLVYIALIATTQTWQAWLAAVGLPLLAYPFMLLAYRYFLAKPALFEFTPETFRVKTLFGWKRFDRQHAHAFALLPHDKALDERDAHDLATRKAQLKGKAIARKRYYGDSFHLSYDYLGQRNDLMTIYGRKEALAIQTRLTACDDVMDGIARKGNGVSLRPTDDWSEQPGDIPNLA